MKLKFVITPYEGQPRSMVWDYNTKEAIDNMVAYLMSDTTGNTKSVTFSLYLPPQPTLKVVEQAEADRDQLDKWFPRES